MDAGGSSSESTETESDRLNRELNELLQELRVAQNGILIIVGFLLVIPFTQRFANVTDFERIVYYLSFLTAGAAAVIIVAPVSYHRMVFRRHDKHSLVTRGNQMAQAGLGLLGIAILGVLVLVTDFLFSSMLLVAATSVLYVAIVGSLWYVVPLHSRGKASEPWRSGLRPAERARPEERPAHT
jgi:L-asparagine transporter-like permease